MCCCSTTNLKSGGCCDDFSYGILAIWAWPIKQLTSISPSYCPPSMVKTWALLLRSRSLTTIITSCFGGCLCFSNDDPVLLLNYAVCTQHLSISISCYSTVQKYSSCLYVWGSTLNLAERPERSTNLVLSFFVDDVSTAELHKSIFTCLCRTQYQLNRVCSSCSYSPLPKLCEFLESLSPLSESSRLDSEVLVFLFGTISKPFK